ELQRVMDQAKATDPGIQYANVLDANLYAPSFHADGAQDWTGIPEKDMLGNRMKRIYDGRWSSPDSVRVGMGPNAKKVPDRASRQQFIDAGCELAEHPAIVEQFMVRVYVRDSSDVVLTLSVPIFVRGQRYGAVSLGWTANPNQSLSA
ncbi:MAG TPA: hypothetical protein VNZ06_02530, partial [Steroidobacteraceae bacterium]|nr:hypothetical protein [Steroidobacteraceae bacterium]